LELDGGRGLLRNGYLEIVLAIGEVHLGNRIFRQVLPGYGDYVPNLPVARLSGNHARHRLLTERRYARGNEKGNRKTQYHWKVRPLCSTCYVDSARNTRGW